MSNLSNNLILDRCGPNGLTIKDTEDSVKYRRKSSKRLHDLRLRKKPGNVQMRGDYS